MTLFLKWLRRALGQWRLIASALVAAAIIHILVTLSSANFTEATSYTALTRDLPVNEPAFGKMVTVATQPLPYFSPDALYSYCHYDASRARVRVSATLPDTGWSLSLHTPKGQNFYYVPGIEKRATNVELVLAPPGNVFAQSGPAIEQADHSIPVVKLPEVKGLIILRAPIKGYAYRRAVDEARGSFRCWTQNDLAARG